MFSREICGNSTKPISLIFLFASPILAAKELQRVGFLNVLGKPAKQFKVPSTHQDRSDK